MKQIVLSLLSLGITLPVFSQVSKSYNSIRIGDEIIKQQVESCPPGESGINKVWDFSRVQTINEAYSLTYSLPPLLDDSLYVMGYDSFLKDDLQPGEEFIVGTEHNTMYYYRMKDDVLYLLGHENPSVKLRYTQPVAMMAFPANYGQAVASSGYSSQGMYSGTEAISTKGSVNMQADAFGKLILPTADTINPVLRIKHTRTIEDADNITTLETYSWYTKGYRYPLFEIVRSINAEDSTELFSTAFYYPPQEHFYLDSDPENLALLEEMWNLDEQDKANNAPQGKESNTDPEIIISHKVYPNPVSTELTIEYTLKDRSDVHIQLASTNGNIIRTIRKPSLQEGTHTETINCSALMWGSYHIKIMAGTQIISQTIIKK